MIEEYFYKDVSHYTELEQEGRGTAESYWLESEDGTRYLWKKEIAEDFLFSEVIAYEISKQLGLCSAQVLLAEYNGEKGILSKDVNYYGCNMVNLIEVYAYFTFHDDICYSWRSFKECLTDHMGLGFTMSYESVVNLLLFDYLIENLDRHYGNIGIDLNTGDIAPYYDNAASLFLCSEDRLSMFYDESEKRRIYYSEIPQYLASHNDSAFIKYGSEFYQRCRNLNIYDILLKIEKCMGRSKYQDYEDSLPSLIDGRVRNIKDVVTTLWEGEGIGKAFLN
jgi:hypothetical protein